MMPINKFHANLQIANTMDFVKLVHPELSYKITGILFAVHNELGRFCNEKQYADAIERHLKKFALSYEREKILDSSFSGEIKGRNRVDFLVENKVLIEVKAKRLLVREDYYQVRRYLQSIDKRLGLLANFRDKYLHPKRILNSSSKE